MGQLAYIRENWVEQLGGELKRLLLATDVLNEEEIAIWMRFHPHGGGRARFGRVAVAAVDGGMRGLRVTSLWGSGRVDAGSGGRRRLRSSHR